MRKSIRHARLFLPHVRKSRDFYLDFLDLISVGLAALAQLFYLWPDLGVGGDKKEVRYAICRGLSIAAVTVGQLKKRLAVATGFASWPTVFQGGGPAVQQLRGRVKRAR